MHGTYEQQFCGKYADVQMLDPKHFVCTIELGIQKNNK